MDVRDPSVLAAAMLSLIEEPEQQRRLADEARMRPLRSWEDYAKEVLVNLAAGPVICSSADSDAPHALRSA